jgi:hypothetical protein
MSTLPPINLYTYVLLLSFRVIDSIDILDISDIPDRTQNL